MTKVSCFLGAAAVCAAGSFSAQASDNGWRYVDVKDVGGAGKGVGLYTTDASVPGVAFRCRDGELFAYVAELPNDMAKAFNATGSVKTFDAMIQAGEGHEMEGRVVYVKSLKSDSIADQTISRSLFNAAIRGDAISLKRDMRDGVTVELPEADPAAFNAFAKACGL